MVKRVLLLTYEFQQNYKTPFKKIKNYQLVPSFHVDFI